MRSDAPTSVIPPETPALALAMSSRAPAQTDAKSRLIAEYLTRFQLVTRGGLYIDGFAAPQSRAHPEAWTARRVLEITPPRLRTFWLCDIEPEGLAQLRDLKRKHHLKPRSRKVFVMDGDFNRRVDDILASGRILPRTAVFALLDQRNTECHWSTVQKLARHKHSMKIEMLNFLGIGWLHRSLLTSHRAARLAELDRWWGGPEWTELKGLTQIEIATGMARRFQKELGYRFASPWPVFLREDGQRVPFFLIHASDHPEAPKLMTRAFTMIYGDRAGTLAHSQKEMFGPPDLG
jgi:three-Cys-motif partner protein